ncbi:class I SAM-dependent methyltransferase [Noviherbaspirillum saxi]|uniref:Class I SAM-dependent methyltransferase n=1 Tax=Noviherbaspirillum saxi TaxID=2320863 RepID=A0A3A3FYP1_9BURK|nr:class I SAM-dependent methyltransferase [Noviherbaspirillum saxi]RJF99808.1 class I SAM-dependent methyltransferase [Noviherbaspirillum saxi]
MKNAINARYSAAPASGVVDRILESQRRKIFDAFMEFKKGNPNDTTLNIGMMPAALFEKPDYLNSWSDQKERARMLSYQIEPPQTGDAQRQTMRISRQEQAHLPFSDRAFDWVACNEVIEHVGGNVHQLALIKELYRVARKGVFVSTSNRRHPIEFNTGIPLLHLLPASWWRGILAHTGHRDWSSESVLNLVDAPALYRFAEMLPGAPPHDVGHKRVFGVKAHFFLMIRKPEDA